MPAIRVNYDAIAHLFDRQPYRAKAVDPELLSFIRRRGADNLSILDIGCGTGNQLVANRTLVPGARLVGLDRSLGMLRQAQPKASDIAWLRADAALLPFRAESFDFVTCQHALHHIQDKLALLKGVFSVFAPGDAWSCTAFVRRNARIGFIMNISRRLMRSTWQISGLRNPSRRRWRRWVSCLSPWNASISVMSRICATGSMSFGGATPAPNC